MAIDTANKRRSIRQLMSPILMPVADGSLNSVYDRTQMLNLYCGIAASTPPVVPPVYVKIGDTILLSDGTVAKVLWAG